LNLIDKLLECTEIRYARPILNYLNASPTVFKCVETAMTLCHSPDPRQRNLAFGFMDSAIQELELDNHNLGSATNGSYQSSNNEQPYPQVGTDHEDGEKPMQDMYGTQNQYNPHDLIRAGYEPSIAQELASRNGTNMPQLNGLQQAKQMDYIVKEMLNMYQKKIMSPIQKTMQEQDKAIKNLRREMKSQEISKSGLAIPVNRLNESKLNISETVPFARNDLEQSRNEITRMNKNMNGNPANTSMYG